MDIYIGKISQVCHEQCSTYSSQLLSVSSFTTASIFGTAFFYYMRTLKPGLSSYINSFLSALWILGFTLLSWYLNGLLINRCDIENWDTTIGVMVCKMYKAVETFTIVGM